MEFTPITKEEFGPIRGKNGKNTEFWDKLDSLEVDFGVKIKREGWISKSDPSVLVSSNYRSERSDKKFSIKTLPNNEGWMILRIN